MVKGIADKSGYPQPDGECRSLVLVDVARLVPSTFMDFQELDIDYLSFSFHKVLAPFGVGVLCAKKKLLQNSLPFLYGGDMIAAGEVTPEYVGYNILPWKYSAGTPNILGTIISAQALRLLLDLVLNPDDYNYFRTSKQITHSIVNEAMNRITLHLHLLTLRALDILDDIEGITIYGPKDVKKRTGLIAFNGAG